jgi:AcrR family transcriptional regulator
VTEPIQPMRALRGGLRSSADPRAQRTRQKVFDAVEQLVGEGGDVTVSAIVGRAGVSRATFYTHFADLDDLAVRLQEAAFDDIAAVARREHSDSDSGAMLASQVRLVQHYADHRPLYAAIFSLPNAQVVQARVSDAMERDIREHIEDLRGAGRLPQGVLVEIAARYLADAATGVIVAWVVGRLDADVDTLARHLLELMPRWMHRGSIGTAGDADGAPNERKIQ